MRTILTFAATLAVAALASAQGTNPTPAQNKAPAKTVTTASAVRKTPVIPAAYRPAAATAAKKPATGATTAAARRTGTRKATPVRTTWRTRQSAPTADRYREIQEALVARGYLSSTEANGAWGQSSTEALKRFQAEQTLASTGRIDSLSLIALGLGPKHDGAVPTVVDGNATIESGRN